MKNDDSSNISNDRRDALIRRLDAIEKEKEFLLREIQSLQPGVPSSSTRDLQPLQPPPKTPEDRIQLFLRLFCCRTDVYPRMWENFNKGIKGFSPVCRNDWKKSICAKPSVKCGECPSRDFIPLDQSVVRDHLEGKTTIGSYSIRDDDSCIFLAADFDKSSWREDADSYRKSAGELGIDIAIERSRSGHGAHAWIFFQAPIQARKARRLGTIILARAASNRHQLNLVSHDRFFPNQDTLPKGGFGSLIALPLQRIPRKSGNTVFVDDSFIPFEDQWAFLSNMQLLSEQEADVILNKNSRRTSKSGSVEFLDEEIWNAELSIDCEIDKLANIYPKEIVLQFGAMLSLDVADMPSRLVTALRRTATFANPKFFELQRLRFSTWKTPRFIFCGEWSDDRLMLPRGTYDEIMSLLNKAGSKPLVEELRPNPQFFETRFTGELSSAQKNALLDLDKHEIGIFVAPPGSGKTVIACALIAKRKVRTLILVHRKQLADQWKSQLLNFLDLDKKKIGVLGSHGKSSGIIDIGMLQTIARSPDRLTIEKYDQIIVDECHHIPAISFENVLKSINARYFLGLTATPYRKDGHQAIIHYQCGPVRHVMAEAPGQLRLEKRVIVRETDLRLPDPSSAQSSIHDIWDLLVSDTNRLRFVAEDMAQILIRGRLPLILSERKDHLELLKEAISEKLKNQVVTKGFLFTGSMGKRERNKALIEIKEMRSQGGSPFLLSTGSLIGEGFDMPELCVLVLAMPISFKGRIVQYAGRIHRESPGKTETLIYDYVDVQLRLGKAMFRKRLTAYKKMGYEIEYPNDSRLNGSTAKHQFSNKSSDLFTK